MHNLGGHENSLNVCKNNSQNYEFQIFPSLAADCSLIIENQGW